MGWQSEQDDEAGEAAGRSPGVPPGRDPRLAQFASHDGTDALLPTGELALLADEVSGPERRSPRATGDELIGLVRAWAALESWAGAAKLGVIRELIRRDGVPVPGGDHGDLPETWSPSLRYELAGALACSTQSAETTAWLAWELQARLPGIGARLDDGTLTLAKARAIVETFKYLTDPDATAAEALIVGLLAGKTYTQVMRLAEQAALTVDPDLAARRREQTQQRNARVTCFREAAGTAALSGRDLPPDETLAAMASVNERADEYRESDAFGDTPMDVLRAQAYLDLLNGVPSADRIARAEPQDDDADSADSMAWAQNRAARAARQTAAAAAAAASGNPDSTDGQYDTARPAPDDCSCAECDGGCLPSDNLDDNNGPDDNGPDGYGPGDDDPGDDDPDGGGPNHGGPDGGHPDGYGPDGGGPNHDGPNHDGPAGRDLSHDDPDDGSPDGGPDSGGPGPTGGSSGPGIPLAGAALQRRPADLIVPLATLLGLAERPGEIQGFGLLDPRLARELAAAAAASNRTEVCVTVTSPEGYAIGHGCARPDRAGTDRAGTDRAGTDRAGTDRAGAEGTALAGFPARLNLTIPATALPDLAGNDRDGPWAFMPSGSSGAPGRASPADGYGSWVLALPGGRLFTVRLGPVPTFDCDHRYESSGYQPSGRLRHLVQVRDGTCTFPSCNRHARESDFEHAHPFNNGGKTCACNAGARSRSCHRVKQSPGWNVTQPRPGWHRWQTPAGRVYVQEPKRYPA